MIRPTKTQKDAVKYRYGRWAGNPQGFSYDPKCCAYEVYGRERFSLSYQCQRKNGHGADGLYCKQHSKIVAEEK